MRQLKKKSRIYWCPECELKNLKVKALYRTSGYRGSNLKMYRCEDHKSSIEDYELNNPVVPEPRYNAPEEYYESEGMCQIRKSYGV